MTYSILGVIHLVLCVIATIEIVLSGKAILHKVLWLVLIYLLPVVGLIIYFLLGRGSR